MEMVKKLEPLALFLMIVAALNWAIVSLFDIYVAFGVSALIWVPRLMEGLHLGHGPHPRGV
jgi:hypothetical protein